MLDVDFVQSLIAKGAILVGDGAVAMYRKAGVSTADFYVMASNYELAQELSQAILENGTINCYQETGTGKVYYYFTPGCYITLTVTSETDLAKLLEWQPVDYLQCGYHQRTCFMTERAKQAIATGRVMHYSLPIAWPLLERAERFGLVEMPNMRHIVFPTRSSYMRYLNRFGSLILTQLANPAKLDRNYADFLRANELTLRAHIGSKVYHPIEDFLESARATQSPVFHWSTYGPPTFKCVAPLIRQRDDPVATTLPDSRSTGSITVITDHPPVLDDDSKSHSESVLEGGEDSLEGESHEVVPMDLSEDEPYGEDGMDEADDVSENTFFIQTMRQFLADGKYESAIALFISSYQFNTCHTERFRQAMITLRFLMDGSPSYDRQTINQIVSNFFEGLLEE